MRCAYSWQRRKGKGYTVKAGDIRTAFLKGNKSGITIYMRMPPGLREYKDTPNGRQEVVCAVEGNLYGKADVSLSMQHVQRWRLYMKGSALVYSYVGLWCGLCGLAQVVRYSTHSSYTSSIESCR